MTEGIYCSTKITMPVKIVKLFAVSRSTSKEISALDLSDHAAELSAFGRGSAGEVIRLGRNRRLGVLVLRDLLRDGAILSNAQRRTLCRSQQVKWFVHTGAFSYDRSGGAGMSASGPDSFKSSRHKLGKEILCAAAYALLSASKAVVGIRTWRTPGRKHQVLVVE